jgi:hypothetical protein
MFALKNGAIQADEKTFQAKASQRIVRLVKE